MKRIKLLAIFLGVGLALVWGGSSVWALDSICLTQKGDETRTSDEDYDCVIQLREVLTDMGLLKVKSTSAKTLQGIYYYPPTPNYPIYYPPTPNINYYYPPTPN